MKKSKKTVFVTPSAIKKLTRLQGLRIHPDSILDDLFDVDFEIPPPEKFFFRGCVTMILYAGSSPEILAVVVREPGGDSIALVAGDLTGPGEFQTDNLSDYRALFETASNFGHGVLLEVEGTTIQQIVLIRCVCPCEKKFIADFFPDLEDTGGVADGVDSL